MNLQVALEAQFHRSLNEVSSEAQANQIRR